MTYLSQHALNSNLYYLSHILRPVRKCSGSSKSGRVFRLPTIDSQKLSRSDTKRQTNSSSHMTERNIAQRATASFGEMDHLHHSLPGAMRRCPRRCPRRCHSLSDLFLSSWRCTVMNGVRPALHANIGRPGGRLDGQAARGRLSSTRLGVGRAAPATPVRQVRVQSGRGMPGDRPSEIRKTVHREKLQRRRAGKSGGDGGGGAVCVRTVRTGERGQL